MSELGVRGRGRGAALHGFGQTEVEDLHLAVGCDLDVRGLEVAMNDAVFMGFFEALGDLLVTGPTNTNVNDFRALLVL